MQNLQTTKLFVVFISTMFYKKYSDCKILKITNISLNEVVSTVSYR